MKRILFLIAALFCGLGLHAQITVNTNFQVNSANPIDQRYVINSLGDTTGLTFIYEGLHTYVKDEDKDYFWDGVKWREVTASVDVSDLVARDSTIQIYLIGAQNSDTIVSYFINQFHANQPRIRRYEVICFNNSADSILTVRIPDLTDSSYVFNQVEIKVMYVKNNGAGLDGLELIVEHDSSFWGPEGYVSTDTLTAGQFCTFKGIVDGGGPDRLIWQEKYHNVSVVNVNQARSLQLKTADGTDTLDFNSKSIGWKLDLSTVTNTTITFTNPDATVFTNYTVHFHNASTDTVNFASVLLDANGDTITQYIFEQGQIVPIYYDPGQDHYTTNYIELPPTTVTYNIGGGGSGSITEGTPTGENLPNLDAGSMYYDDDFLYIKTYQGWQYQGGSGLRNLYAPRDSQLVLDTDGLRLFCMEGYGLTYNSSGLISQWNDLSGNANHITQTVTANKPQIGPSKTVIFDGEDDFMNIPDAIPAGADSTTIIILFEREIDTVGQEAAQRLIHYSQSSAGGVVFYIAIGIGAPPIDSVNAFSFARSASGGSPFVNSSRIYPLNETHLISLRMVSGDSIYQQVNDGTVLSDNYDNQQASTDERYIGKDKDTDTNYFRGRYRLIAIWDRKLTDNELETQKKKIYDHFKIYR